MAGTVVADQLEAASTSTLVLKNGVASTPPTIQDSAGTQIGTFCRAWVNFNGTTNTGGFCTIRGSFNVTSVADNGVGLYTVNFTTAMPDANYGACTGHTQFAAATTNYSFGYDDATYTTTALGLRSQAATGTEVDVPYASISIFR
jgi:hypothetical protein